MSHRIGKPQAASPSNADTPDTTEASDANGTKHGTQDTADPPPSRPIIARFTSRKVKARVMDAKKELRTALSDQDTDAPQHFPGKVFIADDLTQHRARLSYRVRSYVPRVLCSPGPMFPRTYVPRVRCSPILCSPVPMFPDTYEPLSYIPRYLCSPVPVLVPSNIVACFRVALVRKKIPEFSWLHCGRRHLVSHVTVRDRTMACHFFLRPTMFIYDGPSASMRSL